MNQKLQEKVELMAYNTRVVRKSAKLDFGVAANLAALMFTTNNCTADEATIRANRSLLKTRASIFSNMRGESCGLAVLANMSMRDDPQAYMDKIYQAYDAITDGKIYRSENLVFAAMSMVERLDPSQYQAASEKAWATLAKMRIAHPLLTSQDDLTLAFLLSQSDIDIDKLLNEAEACYDRLKGKGFVLNKDTVQTISLLLALSDKPVEQKCAEFLDLREALKASGHKIRSMEQAVIAAFIDLDVPFEQLVSEIGEADDYLKGQKGFGMLTCGSQLRRLFASALVLQTHQEQSEGAAVSASNAVAAYVAQQIIASIIMMIIIVSVHTSHSN